MPVESLSGGNDTNFRPAGRKGEQNRNLQSVSLRSKGKQQQDELRASNIYLVEY